MGGILPQTYSGDRGYGKREAWQKGTPSRFCYSPCIDHSSQVARELSQFGMLKKHLTLPCPRLPSLPAHPAVAKLVGVVQGSGQEPEVCTQQD